MYVNVQRIVSVCVIPVPIVAFGVFSLVTQFAQVWCRSALEIAIWRIEEKFGLNSQIYLTKSANSLKNQSTSATCST